MLTSYSGAAYAAQVADWLKQAYQAQALQVCVCVRVCVGGCVCVFVCVLGIFPC